MKKCLPFLPSHLCIGVAEDKTNGRKEVTLSRAISSDDNVVFGGEGLNHGLLAIATEESVVSQLGGQVKLPFEALNDDLFDMHAGRKAAPLMRACRLNQRRRPEAMVIGNGDNVSCPKGRDFDCNELEK